MDIFLKIVASIFSVGIIGVITALAIAAPVRGNQKLAEIRQGFVFLVIIFAVLYYIWA